MSEQKTADVVKVDEITKFRKQNELLKEDLALLKERLDQLLPVNALLSELAKQNPAMRKLLKQAVKEKMLQGQIEL